MTNDKVVTVTVPATTANLGPGFDCMGAALTLYNQFQFTLLPKAETDTVEITVKGMEAQRVSLDKNNLLYQSYVKLYQHLEKKPPSVAIEIQLGIPLARGLGSSATAIVGGLVGANLLAGSPLDVSEIMELSIALEGHPDNVVPALLGNCQLSVGEAGNWQICEIPWDSNIVPVVAIPDFELSTEEARSVLPSQINRSDAIFNMARLGLLVRGLETGRGDWLRMAMEDKLHQPYRQGLIRGYETVKSAALSAGAYGMVISGAGPTLLAFSNKEQAESIASAMAKAWKSEGVSAEVRSLFLDTQGTKVTSSD
ncbi:MAG: homoserine kinase [Hydrococcus sp. C42_A2020_068]|uniref:homoserine kinase n=1 Tax=Pleurocapsa sp. PCC 7327 TaxID=118163 RepID=UPI00029FFF22|nr:homoserine kinase [Pleurocapsa sp. PCC 7327]AFY78454.1 homoserine kinase [Pleurocapsa sp. PCC 7327]MBF2022347.1 homoserine kinase [Hydrococcus sp. C42_A2020_068]